MAFTYDDDIPTLDLQDYRGQDKNLKSKFIADLGEIYSEIGFVAIINHGFEIEEQHKLYAAVQSFFFLDDQEKQKYDGSFCGGQRGYTGKGKEHAAGRKVGDLKEFFHIGHDIPEIGGSHYQKNIFPEEVPEFQKETLACYVKLQGVGREMLSAISEFMHLDSTHFEDKVNRGISILRPIHYFPIADVSQVPDDAVRAAEHGDINLITLLMGASAEGLQVKRRDGKWIPVKSNPDAIVVNVGDMLERYTNGVLKSTIHRVVNPPKEQLGSSRFSIPFFMHGNPDMELNCLKACISLERPKAYDDITVDGFLTQRLKEIGLI
ncbi:MAG: isopenicillin N synthase-like dioxygenase [Saprospiraceae bacterium]|jgi:isopenicillin N synthase-like dioxygenase